MTAKDFAEYADTHGLDGKEREALAELEGIAFLLGKDKT